MNSFLHANHFQGDVVPFDYFCPPTPSTGEPVNQVVAFVPYFLGADVWNSDHLHYKRLPNNAGWVCTRRIAPPHCPTEKIDFS